MRAKNLFQFVMAVCLFVFSISYAANLFWDVNSVTPGAQPGNGTWDTTLTNWWDGSGNVAWTDGSYATFYAGTPYTVTLAADVNTTRRVSFAVDSNVILNGSKELGLGGSTVNYDGILLADSCSTVVIDCNISNLGSTSTMDPEIQVGGENGHLTVNGDIFVRNVHTGTDDLAFRRYGAGPGYAYITLNGDVVMDSSDGGIAVAGYDGSYNYAGIWVTVNGTMKILPLRTFAIRTGGVAEIGGRLEFSNIYLNPNTSVPDFNQYRPVLRGTQNQQGVLAICLQKYDGAKYIRNGSSGNEGGRVYAEDLNLEVDVNIVDANSANDINFADPSKDTYKLFDGYNVAGFGRWYGSFNSVSMLNAPVGTVISFTNMPAEGASSTNDIFMNVETTDFDNDGRVNFKDFAFLADAYGSSCTDDAVNDNCSGRDLNHSGIVDISDVAIFVGTWLDD